MINYIANILEVFPGVANRTRCFAHILNLVAKCIMRQFDAPKKRQNRSSEDETDNMELALKELAEELEGLEDENDENECEEGGETENEENDELFDGREGMTDDEIHELDVKVRPVRLVLAKVR
jgi:hypothetical protein